MGWILRLTHEHSERKNVSGLMVLVFRPIDSIVHLCILLVLSHDVTKIQIETYRKTLERSSQRQQIEIPQQTFR